MKIKKDFQQLFKSFFYQLFFLIYPKLSYEKNLDLSKHNNSNNIDQIKIDGFNYKCFTIMEGRIYSDLVQNVAVISQNNLIPGANFQQINGEIVDDEKNSCLYKGTPRIKIKKKGTLFCAIQDASENNFSHWLLDILPRLKILEKYKSINEIDYFLFPEIKHNYQYETLKILDIPLEKILNNKKYRHLQSSKMIVTSHPWHTKGYVHKEIINIPKWIILWLREKFLTSATYENINDKIFIDRSDSSFDHCQIINTNEVWNFLKNRGFKKYRLTEINFMNQIGIFNNAKIIVGAHGAGMTNMIFSKPKCKVIELKPRHHINKFFKRVSEINDLDHKEIISEDLELTQITKAGDIFVDINKLSDLIKLT